MVTWRAVDAAAGPGPHRRATRGRHARWSEGLGAALTDGSLVEHPGLGLGMGLDSGPRAASRQRDCSGVRPIRYSVMSPSLTGARQVGGRAEPTLLVLQLAVEAVLGEEPRADLLGLARRPTRTRGRGWRVVTVGNGVGVEDGPSSAATSDRAVSASGTPISPVTTRAQVTPSGRSRSANAPAYGPVVDHWPPGVAWATSWAKDASWPAPPCRRDGACSRTQSWADPAAPGGGELASVGGLGRDDDLRRRRLGLEGVDEGQNSASSAPVSSVHDLVHPGDRGSRDTEGVTDAPRVADPVGAVLHPHAPLSSNTCSNVKRFEIKLSTNCTGRQPNSRKSDPAERAAENILVSATDSGCGPREEGDLVVALGPPWAADHAGDLAESDVSGEGGDLVGRVEVALQLDLVTELRDAAETSRVPAPACSPMSR